MKLGYNTNGLDRMSPVQAIEELARIGYRGVALTLDHDFLDPFAPGLDEQLATLTSALADNRLDAVVETGARFLLDPHTKHEPTLVSPSPEDRARRVAFLQRAVDIAAAINADCVSLWSGTIRDNAGDSEAFDRLTTGLNEVLRHAATKNVVIAFEPEPDMFIGDMSRYGDLLDELQRQRVDMSYLRLTIDIGHLHCQREVPISDYLRAWGSQIANIHIEDMRAGVHEHLMFGEGDIDFPPVIAALGDIGYTGLVNVELSRHSHEGLAAAERAFEFLDPLIGRHTALPEPTNP